MSTENVDFSDANPSGNIPLNRVLIVEDSVTERFRFSALLVNLGYEVVEKANGREALDWLNDNKMAIILSDWSMPEMSGLDLCRQIREEGYGDPYFILVTGRDSMSDLVAGIESGADDFISKPFNREELRVRLIAGQRIMQMRQSLEKQNLELQEYIEREDRVAEQTRMDLQMASEMLVDLLPDNTSLFEHYHLAGAFKPASGIGGDFYNFFKLSEKYIGFYLLDVAGHGIPSALLSFSLARTISPEPRAESILYNEKGIRTPSAVVATLNDRFVNNAVSSKYFTMVYGMVDVTTGKGRCCQAAHPHPLILSGDGNTKKLGDGGFPVGILPDADFEDVFFELAQGDRLVIYSDGMTEAENLENLQFSEESFIKLLHDRQDQPLQSAVNATFKQVEDWGHGREQSDDMTFIVIERS